MPAFQLLNQRVMRKVRVFVDLRVPPPAVVPDMNRMRVFDERRVVGEGLVEYAVVVQPADGVKVGVRFGGVEYAVVFERVGEYRRAADVAELRAFPPLSKQAGSEFSTAVFLAVKRHRFGILSAVFA